MPVTKKEQRPRCLIIYNSLINVFYIKSKQKGKPTTQYRFNFYVFFLGRPRPLLSVGRGGINSKEALSNIGNVDKVSRVKKIDNIEKKNFKKKILIIDVLKIK